jgi:hypothetical protein
MAADMAGVWLWYTTINYDSYLEGTFLLNDRCIERVVWQAVWYF